MKLEFSDWHSELFQTIPNGLKFVTFFFVVWFPKRFKICRIMIFFKKRCYFSQKPLFWILLIFLEIIQRKKNRKTYPEWHWTEVCDVWCDEFFFSFRCIISKTIKNMQNSVFWQKKTAIFFTKHYSAYFQLFWRSYNGTKIVKHIQNGIGLKFVTSGVTNFFFFSLYYF